MKFTAVDVVGFGVWTQLKLDGLSDRITVLYGANEAGKTTLLEFIRAVLYGMPSSDRERFIPPVGKGRAAGALRVEVGGEPLEIRRDFERNLADGGWLEIVDREGFSRGRDVLESALRDVDETTFRHVFAIGIRELQELGTLGDQQAAQWLYDLTAGWDRVSLVEAARASERARDRILDGAGGPCMVADLLDERDQIEREIRDLGAAMDDWAGLSRTATELDRQITELEAENGGVERQAADVRVALLLKDQWDQRAAIQQQLLGLGNVPVLPASGAARLESCVRRLAGQARRREKRRRARRRLREQIRALAIDEALVREGPRIEALAEHLGWIRSLEHRIREHVAERPDGPAPDGGRNVSPRPLATSNAADSVVISPRQRRRLRDAARVLSRARKQAAETQQKAEATRIAAGEHSSGIRQAVLSRDVHDVPAAMQSIGQRAAQLRRCLALDERLERLQNHEAALDEQRHDLMHEQLLPLWILLATGAMFILGVAMMLAGVWLPTAFIGTSGRWLAVLGVLGTGTSGLVKYLMERSVAQRLDDCQKQLLHLRNQVEKAVQERTSLESVLAPAGGPVAVQLQAAENDLAALEQWLPADARRQNAEREAAMANDDARQARSTLDAAEVQWRESLAACSLPIHWTPRDVAKIARRGERGVRAESHPPAIQHDLEPYRHDYELVVSRVRHLAATLGTVAVDTPASELLERLIQRLNEEKPKHERRRALGRSLRRLRRREMRSMHFVRSLVHERDMLLIQAGVSTTAQYQALAAESRRAARLREQLDTLNLHIQSTLAEHAVEEHVKSELVVVTTEQLELKRQHLANRQAAHQEQLKQCLIRRGAVQQELERLAGDRRLAEKQLERCIVEQRLNDAVHGWQVQAATSLLLDELRHEYEQNRQPETLVEASAYLCQLTEGRYTRVWTPVHEDALYLENAQGDSLPIHVLSRGTREQLFLCLRLALVALHARRGIRLPLVLDDVLVNFDDARAKAAAGVLRDFSKNGHQLLVFTCHAHVRGLFQALKVDVRHLPHPTSGVPLPPQVMDAPLDSAGHSDVADDNVNRLLALVSSDEPPSIDEPSPYSIQSPRADLHDIMVVDDSDGAEQEMESGVDDESHAFEDEDDREDDLTEAQQLDEPDTARVYQYAHFHGHAVAGQLRPPAYHFVVSEASSSSDHDDAEIEAVNDDTRDDDGNDEWVRIGQRVRRRSMVVPDVHVD